MFRIMIMSAVLLIVTSVRSAVASDDIEAFGRACAPALVPTELKASTASDYDLSAREVLCSNHYSDQSSAQSGGAGVSIGVVSVDANGNSTTRQVTRDEYCRDASLHISSSNAIQLFTRYATPEGEHAFETCMLIYQGTHTPVNPPVILAAANITESSFSIAFRRDANVDPSGPTPTFSAIAVVGATCKTTQQVGSAITVGGGAAICTWDSQVRYALVQLATSTTSQTVSVVRPSKVPDATAILSITKDVSGNIVSTGETCGSPVSTPDWLHNRECPGAPFRYVDQLPDLADCSDKYLKIKVCAEFSSPPGATIVNPHLHCSRDTERSCGWNAIGDISRQVVAVSDAHYVKICQNIGSKQIDINVCAKLQTSTATPVTTDNVQTWHLAPGDKLEATFDTKVKPMISVYTPHGDDKFPWGADGKILRLIKATPTELGLQASYIYIGTGSERALSNVYVPSRIRNQLRK